MSCDTYDRIPEPLMVEYKTGITSSSITHYHNVHELVLFEHCNARLFSQNVWYDMHDGDIALIPQYTLHHYDYLDKHRYTRLLINFDAAFASSAGDALGFPDVLPEPGLKQHFKMSPAPAKFRQIMRVGQDLLAAHVERDALPANQHMATQRALLFLLLGELRPLLSSKNDQTQFSDASRYVKRAIDYIDANYTKDFQLSDLSARLHIDKYYLCHLFKAHMGIPIVKYVQSRRIVEAQKMMLYTDKPIDLVSELCGFHCIQHFYKVFKEVTGYPPLKYMCHHRTMAETVRKE